MGREIKRVALDFDWPINVTWKGFVNPYSSQTCSACDGSGHNPETKQISDDWYDFAGTGRKWCYNITQHEVDALIERGRLYDFTHQWTPGKGWQKIEPPPVVTADMVNQWSRHGLGHDSINHWVCVEARAKRLGVYGECPACNGEGQIWFNEHIKELCENWYDNERYEPPAGEGWQVWETVSEGSPVTPVLPTKEALIEYLVQNGDAWDQKRGDGGWERENAKRFVNASYAPSLVVVDGKIRTPRDGGA
jgi:hypothetical protein